MKSFGTFIFNLFATFAVLSADLESEVKISMISVFAEEGSTLIQTTPRHAIDGLTCTNSYWLRLNITSKQYDSILSILLTAKAADLPVLLQYTDEGADQFCNLERVTLK